MRKMARFFMCVLLLSFWGASLRAEMRASEDFEGFFYEGDVLPGLANPIWDGIRSAYTSIVDGKLEINTMTGGTIAWVLPGPFGAEYFDMPHNYPAYPEEGWQDNPWKGFNGIETGYTVEMSIEFIDSAAGAWGFSLYIGEGSHGALYDVQMFKDRIHSGGVPEDGSTTLMHNGDLTGSQHKIRFVRLPGAMDDPYASPQIQVYVDDILSYAGGRHIGYTYDNNILVGSAWNQDWLYLASYSGSAQYHVEIDYLRIDFTGAYAPVPEPATMAILGLGSLLLLRKRRV